MSKIGHNKPPRKINYKSISLNKWIYEELERLRDFVHTQRKLDAVLDKKHIKTVKKFSIPEVIELCYDCYYLQYILPHYLYGSEKTEEKTLKSLIKDKDFKKYAE